MQQIIILILLIAVVLGSNVVYAQNTSLPTQSSTAVRERLQNQAAKSQQTIQETREQARTRVDAFKERVQQIRDETRKMVVERIVSKIENANIRLTGIMSNALDKMSAMLKRVKDRAETFAASGENVTALLNAIVEAESAIGDANEAVDKQAEKQYSANITDDATIGSAIRQMVSQFRQDIRATHQFVVTAKQAVAKAISEAAKLGGIGRNATDSVNLER